jgi:hypothetical protein
VTKGQTLLKLRNPDLANQIADVRGKFNATQEQLQAIQRSLIEDPLSAAERTKLGGEKAQLEKQRESLEEQVKILNKKYEQLEVKAPIDGQVISWDIKKLLEQRPVSTGQVLLTVADPKDEWELELLMPERRSGKVDAAQEALKKQDLQVSYILATDPDTKYWGTVKQDDLSIMPDPDEGSVLRIRAHINKDDLYQPRPGATVTAKVYCGYRPIGWCWFHEAVEWVQASPLFF